MEGLASGRAPKQLAHQWGASLATVRTHIKNAKRKTGARTLYELAAMTARPDWPDLHDRGP
jgi:DNA-binding CsgD family transcriptional regulator